jgi:hypothetical protein
MKSSNRFLFGFGIALVALVVVTILLVVFSGRQVTTYPANTPEGVVQGFLQAVQAGDYPRAYSYTQVVENGKTLTVQDLIPYVGYPPGSPTASWRATLGKTTTTDNTSMVEVIVDRLQPQGPFGNPVNTQTVLFNLTRINGTWYITQRPPVYWIY